MPEPRLTAPKLAKAIGYSVATVRRWVKDRQIPFERGCGKKSQPRFVESEVRKVLKQNGIALKS